MAGTSPELMQLALQIVAANEPCKPGFSVRRCASKVPASELRARPFSS
jgi:hypothetical protein